MPSMRIPAMLLCTAMICAAQAGGADVSGTAIIPVSDPQVVAGLSPYNWIVTPEAVCSSTGGTSLTVAFKGTSTVAVQVDTSALAGFAKGRYPIIAWKVGRGERRSHQLAAGETSIELATGVADPVIDLYCQGFSPFEERYAGAVPPNAVRITGFAVRKGARTVASARPGRIWLNIGDSIMSGDGALQAKGQGRPADDAWAASNDARASYGYLLASHFGCRESRIAYGGYNWRGGMAGIPALTTLIDHITASTMRTAKEALTPAPDVVLINLGENGETPATVIAETLGVVRRRVGPAATLVVMVPLSGRGRDLVTAGVKDYIATSKDAATRLLDLGAMTIETGDGQHPTAAGHRAVFDAAVGPLERILGKPK